MAGQSLLPFFDRGFDPRPKLGHLLVQSGAISQQLLENALAKQVSSRSRSRLGDILVADGVIDAADMLKALSRQNGIGRVDLSRSPPDQDLLDSIDVLACLRLGYLPWRKFGNVTILAISDPEQFRAVRANYRSSTPDIAFALAESSRIRQAIIHHFQVPLTRRASYLCPSEFSCRTLQSPWTLPKLGAIAIAAFVGAMMFPGVALAVGLSVLALANIGTATLRLLAFGATVFPGHAPSKPIGAKISAQRALPCISVLVPLYRESGVIAGLLDALTALDYPRSLLDLKLILEADDDETATRLLTLHLPAWADVIVVPAGSIRTKPRAMNYALPFCKGEIIGIYDAEDRPEADQLRKVAATLAASPRNVACVQAALDFYNTGHNWLSRCFTIEYAQWFRVILPGLRRLGLPVPLGGTSVFFRRGVLEKLGGWDAHNVTEDADLGMRLARRGYRCVSLDSTTNEEAPTRGPAWIRQRSRWLKGYAITWASHMRRPFILMDDLGFVGFLAFQAIFLGTLAGYLAFPMHAVLWADLAGIDFAFKDLVPERIWFWFAASHFAGLIGLVLVAARALMTPRHRNLLPVLLTMPIYWPLGAIASWRALVESLVAPFYWAKTEHGVDQAEASATDFSRTSNATDM